MALHSLCTRYAPISTYLLVYSGIIANDCWLWVSAKVTVLYNMGECDSFVVGSPQCFNTLLAWALSHCSWEFSRRVSLVHIIWPDVFVDMVCMCFAWIVTHILSTGLVVYLDILLCGLEEQPEIAHFHCAWVLPLDWVVDNANAHSVVYMYRGLWLWMSHLI